MQRLHAGNAGDDTQLNQVTGNTQAKQHCQWRN